MLQEISDRLQKGRIDRASFRDPSGFVFYQNAEVFRQVNHVYKEHYDHYIASGLRERLEKESLVIPFREIGQTFGPLENAYKILQPEKIQFISYPYEWCFSQLKDAALVTLNIQRIAIDFGMTLKDASAFNIQFVDGKPTHIDTLSFEKYEAGTPWIAYRQFCQHFLAPLSLTAYRDPRLNRLLRGYIDGTPLDLASVLLPKRTWLKLGLALHIHLHGISQKRLMKEAIRNNRRESDFRGVSMHALVDSLTRTVSTLRWESNGDNWTKYYSEDSPDHGYLRHKAKVVGEYLDLIAPKSVWDIGSNTGFFSRMAARQGIKTYSLDADISCVEQNYRQCKKEAEKNLLPLWLDFANPSPSIGWDLQERRSILNRGLPDTVFALGLIHHLSIAGNVPLDSLAMFFSRICRFLIIEFVPKNDPRVQQMLALRKDLFAFYNQERFESDFGRFFHTIGRTPCLNSSRTLYLMNNRSVELPGRMSSMRSVSCA